ncbi:hypothetical protein IFM12275_69150 (plasmid) [Nocardia sputorum]|nr:hypothetical protein IFM12275_69150 [Nocardia sputorum]
MGLAGFGLPPRTKEHQRGAPPERGPSRFVCHIAAPAIRLLRILADKGASDDIHATAETPGAGFREPLAKPLPGGVEQFRVSLERFQFQAGPRRRRFAICR